MATVLFKVFTLTLKTASKPLAAQFERYVMHHEVLRSKVIAIAQFVHRWDVSLTRSAEGKSGKVFVGDMSEEKAVQLASKVVSEGFVYGTAILILILETDRRKKEDEVKKAKTMAEKRQLEELHMQHRQAEEDLRKTQDNLQEMLERMDERTMMLEEQIMDLRRDFGKRRWF